MSDNLKNVVKYEVLEGIAVYAFVHKPDRGNDKEKIAPAYKIDLCFDKPDQLKKAKGFGLTIKDADAKHPHPYTIIKSKVDENRPPPLVVDSRRNTIPPNILIGNGSRVLVRFLPYGYGKGKVTGIFKEVMVLDLVRYEPSPEELERKGFIPPREGGFVVGAQEEPVA